MQAAEGRPADVTADTFPGAPSGAEEVAARNADDGCMTLDVKRDFARMIAARQRLMDLRTSRNQQLVRLRAALTVLLSDFVETLDPVSNSRLAEVSIEGSKTHGESAVTVSFFEGTRFRLSVDTNARFTHTVSIASDFDDCAQIFEIRVSEDARRAELSYEPASAPGTRKTVDLVAFVAQLVAHALRNVEAEVAHISQAPASPAENAPSPSPAPAVSRVAAAVASSVAAITRPRGLDAQPLRLTIAEQAPSSDVLTLRVG